MPALVKRGADEVVHRRVHDRECLARRLLHVLHGGEKNARIADEETPRLEQNLQAERSENRQDCVGIILRRDPARVAGGSPPLRVATRQRRIINDPDPASDAEKLDAMAGLNFRNERGQLPGGLGKWARLQNLRADVRLDPPDFQVRQRRGSRVNFHGPVEADPKLVFAFSGRDELVGLRVDIRVHAQGDRGDEPERASDFVDAHEFGLALDVEAIHPLL